MYTLVYTDSVIHTETVVLCENSAGEIDLEFPFPMQMYRVHVDSTTG